MEKQRLYRFITTDYQLLKQYENGDCYGADHKQIQPSVQMITNIVSRFYSYINMLPEEEFTLEELARIDDARRAVDRNSQNPDSKEVIRVLMYDIEDIMRIINLKQSDSIIQC